MMFPINFFQKTPGARAGEAAAVRPSGACRALRRGPPAALRRVAEHAKRTRGGRFCRRPRKKGGMRIFFSWVSMGFIENGIQLYGNYKCEVVGFLMGFQ